MHSPERVMDRSAWAAWLAVALAVLVYLYGLGSEFIPKNGDEYVYTHITRLTAANGHWLPLQSELHAMRNTKPPMLFWQGMLSTRWGQDWTLWDLRWPNTLYTLLTACLAGLLAWRLSERGRGQVAVLAGLLYLGFFSTYRFGRPFLTNAPETFWLFLPCVLLLWKGESAYRSKFMPWVLGGVIGIGLLYKSFAMLFPVGVMLTLWYARHWRFAWRPLLCSAAPRLAVVAATALAVFALWFVLDPDPAAIWQEFVVGENAGKFDPQGGSYWVKLLWGTSSLWSLAFGFLQNAAVLAPLVLALFVWAWRSRQILTEAEKRLWIWVLVLFAVFAVPSQRSARYLLDVMPVLAVLLALRASTLPRWAFLASQGLCLLACVGEFWVLLQLNRAEPGLYGVAVVSLFAAAFCLMLLGLRRTWQTLMAPVSALLVWGGMALVLSPLDGPHGRFDGLAQALVEGKTVAVPYNFNAKYEVYRFLLPGAKILGYHEDEGQTVVSLATEHPAAMFVIEQGLDEAPPACPGCVVLAERLKQRSRQRPEEIQAMLHGRVFEFLFAREYLVQKPIQSTQPARGGSS